MSGQIMTLRPLSPGAQPRRAALVSTQRQARQAASPAEGALRVTVWVPAELDRTSRGAEVQR